MSLDNDNDVLDQAYGAAPAAAAASNLKTDADILDQAYAPVTIQNAKKEDIVSPAKLGRAADLVAGFSPIGGYLMSAATGMASNLGATGAVIKALASGQVQSLGDASRLSEAYLKAHPAYTPPEGSDAAGINKVMSSGWNPLNWPGVALDKGGELLSKGLTAAGVPGNVATAAGPIAAGAATAGLGTYALTSDALGGGAPAKAGAAPAEATAAPLTRIDPAVAAARDALIAKNPDAAINPVALTRHLEDQSLDHPFQLSEGQATGDPVIRSNELNGAGIDREAVAARLNAQNGAAVRNLNAIRDRAAPDSGLSATPEHAQTLIDAYKAKDEAATADIGAKYQAVQDAYTAKGGTGMPIDTQALLDNVSSTLKKNLATNDAPPSVMSALAEWNKGDNVDFQDFETMRSKLARIQRSDPNGETRYAAGLIRGQLEQVPLSGDAADLKGLADEARASAKARFDAIDADPAYKAVVNGNAASNTFANKYVLNAARENLAELHNNIGEQPEAQQAVSGIVANQLRARSGINADGQGNFSQGGYNKTLESLRPNLDLLLDPNTAKYAQTFGNVARYAQEFPKGHFISTANTAPAMQSYLTEAAKNAAETGTNMAFKGVPVGTVIRKVSQAVSGSKAQAARQAATERALAPGAGSGVALSDLLGQGANR